MHDLPRLELPVRYRSEVLSALEALGVAPRPDTQPRLVYSFLRALYTFEIRERKARRREAEAFLGRQPLSIYSRQIDELRRKYFLLRVPVRQWVERNVTIP